MGSTASLVRNQAETESRSSRDQSGHFCKRPADRRLRTVCMTLAYAGRRLSEALTLTAARVDRAAGVLLIENLKKRPNRSKKREQVRSTEGCNRDR